MYAVEKQKTEGAINIVKLLALAAGRLSLSWVLHIVAVIWPALRKLLSLLNRLNPKP